MDAGMPRFADVQVRERVCAELVARFGARAQTSLASREQHSHGEGLPDSGLPDIVVFPETTAEVAAIAQLCHGARMPIVAYGAGTSLEGHVAALCGGVSVDFARMNRLLEVNVGSLDCRVEAGVTREQLNAEIRATGLFFPVDPGANATLGGMASTRASGTSAVRYGTMRENVLGLTVVTPDGQVVRTGGRARKSAAGYDLTRLYVGSEGTLGLVTEVQLRLYGAPEVVRAATCQFPDVASAVNAVIAALQSGIPMARIELVDAVQMGACIAYSQLTHLEAADTLFLEFHGAPAAVDEQVVALQAISSEFGGYGYHFAEHAEDRNRLWKARHSAYQALLALAPSRRNMGTDACVPIDQLSACIAETQTDIEASGLVAAIVGHVGDGNFHVGILFDPHDADERGRAERLAAGVSRRAIRMGGTCTGEHGIGLHKLAAMAEEHGAAVALMRGIKQAFDPHGIMNPGKTIPTA
ncbi:MAG: FAD-binding protein [Gemmatimonadaceae bacterium]|nr:FAD-binding protein [Gemmatimonadaceae bacterium]